MRTYEDALARWTGEGGDELRRTGVMVLDPIRGGDDARTLAAVVMSELLVALPIRGTGTARPLTRTGALALAVEMTRAGRVDMDKSAMTNAADILDIVTGVYDSVRQAAFAAVRQLGGGDRVPLRPWMVAALEDPETPDDAVPDSVINSVELAAMHTSPGLSWTGYAFDLGYVLYRRS